MEHHELLYCHSSSNFNDRKTHELHVYRTGSFCKLAQRFGTASHEPYNIDLDALQELCQVRFTILSNEFSCFAWGGENDTAEAVSSAGSFPQDLPRDSEAFSGKGCTTASQHTEDEEHTLQFSVSECALHKAEWKNWAPFT